MQADGPFVSFSDDENMQAVLQAVVQWSAPGVPISLTATTLRVLVWSPYLLRRVLKYIGGTQCVLDRQGEKTEDT